MLRRHYREGMHPTWPIIGTGRSAVVFDVGGGQVLRRHLDPGHDAVPEAEAMQLAALFGVPVPSVRAVSGAEITMRRADGPTLLSVLLADPGQAVEAGAILAGLHDRLDRVRPDGLAAEVGLVHGDLHPDNVIMTGDGPVLIDWTNHRYGPRSLDVAITWIVLACFLPDGLASLARAEVRGPLLDAFLDRVDRAAAVRALPAAAQIRYADPGTTPIEHHRIETLCRAEA